MNRLNRMTRTQIVGLILCCIATAWAPCSAADKATQQLSQSATAAPGLYVKVRLDHPLKLSRLKSGDVIEGSLGRDVYSADRELFSAGDHVRLTVDHLEKRSRPRDDHWPWAVKVFTPRHQPYPVFRTGTVTHGSAEIPLNVNLISVTRLRDVRARIKKNDSTQPSRPEQSEVEASRTNSTKAATPTMILEASIAENQSGSSGQNGESSSQPEAKSFRRDTIPAATRCKILLLGDVSASKSAPGDPVRARLLEPVMSDSKVILPAGTLFEGKVVRTVPPRWLSRAGSLYLTFTRLTLPDGDQVPISASLAGAELDRQSHTKIDSEGQLHGERPGKAWMAINFGVSAGLAKVSDDTIQLVIELIVSTATDVSTAGAGRIAAGCVSGVYMVTRHGRDVILPRFTEMEISLDRAVSLDASASSHPATIMAGGK